jgi:hypothetical protein
MPTDKEIELQLEKAIENEIHSKKQHLTYEAGVQATILWMMGKTNETPLE